MKRSLRSSSCRSGGLGQDIQAADLHGDLLACVFVSPPMPEACCTFSVFVFGFPCQRCGTFCVFVFVLQCQRRVAHSVCADQTTTVMDICLTLILQRSFLGISPCLLGFVCGLVCFRQTHTWLSVCCTSRVKQTWLVFSKGMLSSMRSHPTQQRAQGQKGSLQLPHVCG